MSLHQRVLTARKKRGLTQEELAELAKLTVRTIQRIESGETTPRPYTLKAIAAALDVRFDDLYCIEAGPKEPAHLLLNTETIHRDDDTLHFLQLFCLSCFSYLVLPYVHFLIPICLLKKRKESNPIVLAYARTVIRLQIYWVIALNMSLLITLAYNFYCSAYLNSSYLINYLVPFFAMYAINALMVLMAFYGSKRAGSVVPSISK